jgi:peptidyl-prolyl cis-trans isomerase B (cyclophilin B)
VANSSSKAAKRERQKLNRQARLEQEAAIEKRRKFWRSVRTFVIILIPIAILFGFLALRGSSSSSTSDKKSSTSSATTKSSLPAPSSITIDPAKTYTATIDTTEGTFSVALDAANAPTSVNNFVYLAKAGFFDKSSIFRVATYVFQTGSPTNTGVGDPGYTVQAELPTGPYQLGSVAWGKAGPEPAGTAGSQFFVITDASYAASLPRQYGTIGLVTSGQDVLTKISALAPASGDGKPTKDVTMNKVTITES